MKWTEKPFTEFPKKDWWYVVFFGSDIPHVVWYDSENRWDLAAPEMGMFTKYLDESPESSVWPGEGEIREEFGKEVQRTWEGYPHFLKLDYLNAGIEGINWVKQWLQSRTAPKAEDVYTKEDLWQTWLTSISGAKISMLGVYKCEFEAWLKIGLPKATNHKLSEIEADSSYPPQPQPTAVKAEPRKWNEELNHWEPYAKAESQLTAGGVKDEHGGKLDGNPFNEESPAYEYWRRGYIHCLNAAATWQSQPSPSNPSIITYLKSEQESQIIRMKALGISVEIQTFEQAVNAAIFLAGENQSPKGIKRPTEEEIEEIIETVENAKEANDKYYVGEGVHATINWLLSLQSEQKIDNANL